MEPMNAVVKFDGDTVRIWSGSQVQTVDQVVADAIFGAPPARVLIDTKYAGGSFGRRAVPNWDYLAEAATAVKAWGKPTGEACLAPRGRHAGRLLPSDIPSPRQGRPRWGWGLLCGSTSSLGSRSSPAQEFQRVLVKNGVDASSVEGVTDMPYAIPNVHAELHTTKVGAPVLWWRSVGHTHTA